MKLKTQLTLLALVLAFAACKKNKPQPQPLPDPPKATRQQQTLDSMFLYAKQIYYWNANLPSYDAFNPRQYNNQSTDLANYSEALLNITKYSNPYEWKPGATSSKFSYIFDKANKNPTGYIAPTMSVDLEGNGNDLGIRFGLYGSESNYVIYVTAVYQNSPAEKLGFARGDVVKKINGTSYGTNFNSEVNSLNAGLAQSTVVLEGQKADGITSFNKTITKGVFKSSPLYKAKVYSAGAKTIGYLAYARFSNASNSYTVLDSVFNVFATKGVTDLVIDFRYNGGGYVSTAQRLINLIAPSSASGMMFAEHFNATMQNGQASIMSNQPLVDGSGKIQYSNGKMLTYADVNYSISSNTTYFSKLGNLMNVNNIVFLVSGGTASASELVINSLKPYVNVKLVGKTTYGKPIGFFPVTLENKYDVYFSMFETKNSAGQGGYYAGMTPDYVVDEVPSGTVMYDFGDVRDNYFNKALAVLAPGTVATPMSYKANKNISLLSNPPTAQIIQTEFLDKEFKGMIENRFKIKP